MDFDQVVQAEIRKIQAESERLGKAEGERLGKAEGERLGETRGLRVAVRALCEVLGITLTAEQQAHLDSLDLDGLRGLRAHLTSARAWPVDALG